MRFKYAKLVALGLVALAVALLTIYLFQSGRATPVSEPLIVNETERLKIPSIGVDASIEHVALTSDGTMGTPEVPYNVGWYSLGPYPGEEGSAVIAGHRGWSNNTPAVFDDLDHIEIGDKIVVINSRGEERTFAVREKRIYERDSIAREVFESNGGSNLNLITCVGEWNRSLQSSEQRLVVFAELIPPSLEL
jgi:LPXTG-site transpeptidase (sortase) family protein